MDSNLFSKSSFSNYTEEWFPCKNPFCQSIMQAFSGILPQHKTKGPCS